VSRHVVAVVLASGKRLYYYRVGVDSNDEGEAQAIRRGEGEQDSENSLTTCSSDERSRTESEPEGTEPRRRLRRMVEVYRHGKQQAQQLEQVSKL